MRYGDNKVAFECKGCGRLLAMTDGSATIVCPRCKGINSLNIETMEITYKPKPPRTTSSGMTFR